MTRHPNSRHIQSKNTGRLIWSLAGLVLLLLLTVTAVVAQSPPPAVIRITAVDDSQFPQVSLSVITIVPPGGPITDSTSLSLRENGIPIAYDTASTPVGVDVTFVVDANGTMLDVDDDSGQTRWQKVQATIGRFAADFMDPTGLDRVSIVLPEETGENGRFLIENETDPAAVMAAIENVPPLLVSPTPLNEMLERAISQAAGQMDDGRYQAILLLTDAGQIHVQLPFDALVQQAQAINLPLFVGILGARADADELFRANRLAEPTLAAALHLPQPDAADPIFDIWGQQRSQLQLQYESLLRQNGQYTISVNQGEVRDLTTWELILEPPEVTIAPPESAVQREGSAPDTLLADLQPQSLPLPVVISWPDGKPRSLLALSWTVNGWPQPAPETLAPDAEGQILLEWDLRTAVSGDYEIIVQVADEFGLTAQSDPVTISVAEERPLPPTATPLPTAVPTSTPAAPAIPGADLLLTPWFAAVLVLGLVAVGWWGWRRRARTTSAAGQEELPVPDSVAAEPPPEPEQVIAVLEPFLGDVGVAGLIVLTRDSTSIGRDTAVADLVLADASVARLHARILRQGDAYWLYDEGSAAGTFHNYGRVGLAPQRLEDGDQIGLGRVQLHFYLRPAASVALPPNADEEE